MQGELTTGFLMDGKNTLLVQLVSRSSEAMGTPSGMSTVDTGCASRLIECLAAPDLPQAGPRASG